jgi:hypothetical protein
VEPPVSLAKTIALIAEADRELRADTTAAFAALVRASHAARLEVGHLRTELVRQRTQLDRIAKERGRDKPHASAS